MLSSQNQSKPANLGQTRNQFPHDELDAIDKENVARLLEINAKIQSLFRKHPFFETDPVCRLAREMCIIELSDGRSRKDAELEADRLVLNGNTSPTGGPIGPVWNRGPTVPRGDAKIAWHFVDMLCNAAYPRPLWMAWITLASAAIQAQRALEGT